jgi:hypothetical protein
VTWSNFISAAPAAQHAVQLYEEPEELAATVRTFLEAGFRNGEPAIVIARPDLAERIEAHDLLTIADAEQTLDRFMADGRPSPARFGDIVGGLVDAVAARHPGKTLRAFGEMVDILWQRNERTAAIALEELWNELAETRDFALLCGYRVDVFDPAVQRDGLPDVLRAHTHARPADPARLAAAVDRALTDVVGPAQASHTYLRIAEDVPRSGVPRAQAMLGWLSANDPSLAAQVLTRARALYST